MPRSVDSDEAIRRWNVYARQLLQATYDWFAKGFDIPALEEAKALLDVLA